MAAGTGAETTAGDIWGAVVGISAVVSIVVGLAMQFLARRRASWTFFDEHTAWEKVANPDVKSGPPALFVTLANTGDGDAFRVRTVGLGCRVWPETDVYKQWVAGARPNDKVLPKIGSGVSTRIVVVAEPEMWHEASIAVTWTASPTWLQWFSRRARYMRLERLAPLPDFLDAARWEHGNGTRQDVLPHPPGPLLDDASQPRHPPRPRWTHPVARLCLGHRVRHPK